MIMVGVLYGFIALFISLAGYYFVSWLAYRLDIIDQPIREKIHQTPTPRLGGLAIFLAFVITIYLSPADLKTIQPILWGAIAIVIVGLLDDKYTLRAMWKLLSQVIIVLAVIVYSDIAVTKLFVPFFGLVHLEPYGHILTFIWMIGIINAINLIDGLDGLAAGVTMIALATMGIMAIIEYQILLFSLCIILIGAISGFLVFNFHPAKIYMGDTGSLFLGYMMGVLPLLGLFKQVTFLGFIIPLVILTVPIFDTLFVMLQRLLNGQNIFHRDQKHIHYKLLQQGWSHKETVLIIYSFATCFATLSIIMAYTMMPWKWLVILIYVIVIILFARFVWKVPSEQ
ncbi:MraY family glycosyltransferase [Gracilibacillus sp. YIM 98692]|uniref:glycosyltransferase family 4 protein n=1 Tax=Gracilibacillus sp. YIM 98692 TaxID=2663532 RepID=UPI0013D66FD6|nr:MraY family glycosyltransferase [Gracilibacillus sp. YIM 98692]